MAATADTRRQQVYGTFNAELLQQEPPNTDKYYKLQVLQAGGKLSAGLRAGFAMPAGGGKRHGPT